LISKASFFFLTGVEKPTFFRIIFVFPLLFMAENDFLTVSELCEWLRLGKSTIYSLVQKNEIPYIKVGGKILFERAKIKVWIEHKSNY